jgi:hypothetical protein
VLRPGHGDLYSILENQGDSVECRIFHAVRTTVDDRHCGSASADSTACSQ